ncbi:MAG: hypothetical protein ABSG43_30860 [Solirubrobacteraceae bacterium]
MTSRATALATKDPATLVTITQRLHANTLAALRASHQDTLGLPQR